MKLLSTVSLLKREFEVELFNRIFKLIVFNELTEYGMGKHHSFKLISFFGWDETTNGILLEQLYKDEEFQQLIAE